MYTSRPLTFRDPSYDPPRLDVIIKPDTEEYPSGGELHEYRDLKGQLKLSIFYPEEDETFPVPWEPPLASETDKYKLFPFTSTLTIRIWDPDVAGVRAFALDFVDANGNPQRLYGSGIKVDIRRANRGPTGEGLILSPGSYTTALSETFRIYGGVPYDFYHQGQLIKSYTFPVDMLRESEESGPV
ncbi:hypothetical protein ARMSODRAFT_1086118 [Armillaria solidipes]|uniref:Uncharacterized protein n=1 Tax=Armillaria solidipes TaxID=1076256 RepID=A0A2H3B9S2_9AGAR|nr:hypothetical protein ARMSODRAFT_1086118 [Armillaria solidipes]